MASCCASTQIQIKNDYPELKIADPCPACQQKIAFHANPILNGKYFSKLAFTS